MESLHGISVAYVGLEPPASGDLYPKILGIFFQLWCPFLGQTQRVKKSPVKSKLFFVGNKRSGSTYVSALLNLHPEVFVALEADVVWFTYHWLEWGGIALEAAPRDDRGGMRHTWRVLNESKWPWGCATPGDMVEGLLREWHDAAAEWRIEPPWLMQPSYRDWVSYRWVGDRKPTSHSVLGSWVAGVVPDVKLIHVVRDPSATVASMMRCGWLPEWRNVESAWRFWADVERDVLALPGDILHVRYEDVWWGCEMGNVWEFLGLDPVDVPARSEFRSRYRPALMPRDPYVLDTVDMVNGLFT